MHLGLKALPFALLVLTSVGRSQTVYVAHEGVGSGRLNGVAFASTAFTIRCDWSVTNVQSPAPGILIVDHGSASIELAGVGTFDFLTPTGSFNNQNVPVVGFGRSNAADLFNGPFDAAFAGWDLVSPIGPVVGNANILQWDTSFGDIVTSGGILVLDNANGVTCTFTASFSPIGIGANYCGPGVANSTGNPGRIRGTGSTVVANNNLTLVASGLPLNSFGFFLTSRTQGNVAQPGGSQGVLCLGGSIGRYVGPGQIKNSGALGSFDLLLDLTRTPTPTGLVAIAAGETWNFQAWHRDAVGGVATSNFTDGLQVQFQ